MSRRRSGTIWAIAVVFLFVVAAASVLRLHEIRTERGARTTHDFRAVVRQLEEQDSESALDLLDAKAPSLFRLRALTLHGAESKLLYAWAHTPRALLGEPGDGSSASVVAHPLWDEHHSTQVSIDGSEALITASFSLLSWSDLYPILRDALAALLLFALAAVIAFPALAPSRRSPPKSTRGFDREDRSKVTGASSAHVEPGAAHQPSESLEFEAQDEEIHSAQPLEPVSTEEALTEESAATSRSKEVQQSPGSGLGAEQAGEPPPFVSPRSGLSFGEHLLRRLALELERIAANDQDLSLAVIALDTPEERESVSRSDAALFLEHFPFEDLVFESGPRRVCIIFPAFSSGDALERIKQIRRSAREQSPPLEIRGGLAGRNGRLVNADRLLEEAESALDQADAPGEIVTFEADPQRFREYLRKQSDAP